MCVRVGENMIAFSPFEQEIKPSEREKVTVLINGFLGLSLNDGTILFLVILSDKTVSVE